MFQRSGVEGGGDGGGVSNKALMEENEIYASAEEGKSKVLSVVYFSIKARTCYSLSYYTLFFAASEFWVAVQRTDAAARCGINGSYWLHVGRETLQLKDVQTKNVIREWPYELLRRYGKDKVLGHMCQTRGPRANRGPPSWSVWPAGV